MGSSAELAALSEVTDDDVFRAFGSYGEARADFKVRASDLGARLHSYHHPEFPDLSTDIAVLGPENTSAVLFVVSGTHGIEGHAGSAIQRKYMHQFADANIGVVLVHALNPYGFEYDRRVNEDNVDINRNFQTFTDLPANVEYRELHDLLVPLDWSGPEHERAQQKLITALSEHGLEWIQTAITRGQHEYTDGLFFGGMTPTWSNETLRQIVREHVAGARHVGYIDLHTGLGDRAAGETIFRGGDDSDAFARAVTWYGSEVTSSDDKTSSSTPIEGNSARAVIGELSDDVLITAITLEFGTQDGATVLAALQGDNWFALEGRRGDARYEEVRGKMFDAFAPSDVEWREKVLQRGGQVLEQACAGLRMAAGIDSAVRAG
ncbi:DUF2817 domain-containing protein [Nocardia camponoti]|uniref:DUF2817 domain-containing protein n=1 Tax=Nocardia camponoti TaxID=1616106 RepID=A0A917QQJ0_9NOCA|nr:DUF2817 domain-containing protein [Nocardia camponoti]GGK63263.1 hypothetical protein GCM10011591_39420 [Nocardia camponoti]